MCMKFAALACILATSGALAVYAIARPHQSSQTAAQSSAPASAVPTTGSHSNFLTHAPEAVRPAGTAAPTPKVTVAAAPAPAEFAPQASLSPVRSAAPACSNPNALGVSRVVEIDTKGGPGFGFEHFKMHDSCVTTKSCSPSTTA